MSIKDNRKYSNDEIENIWLEYINNKVWDIYFKDDLNEYDDKYNLNKIAPCPWCGEQMHRKDFNNDVENNLFAWIIDSADGDLHNNDLKNLQPIHPRCKFEKYNR